MSKTVSTQKDCTSSQFPAGPWAILISLAVCIGSVIIGGLLFGTYALVMFVALPVSIPILIAVLDSIRNKASFGRILRLSMVYTPALFMLMLVGGVEGLLCVAMAAPLWFGATFIGVGLGYCLTAEVPKKRNGPTALLLIVLLPTLSGADSLIERKPSVFSVTTAVEIDMPPDVVWRHVIAFPPLREPTEWMFRLGIAYPTHAEIAGAGVGAVRKCWFTTGPFVEPITQWQPGRRLAFAVTENPSPMRELSPYENLDLPHLHGFMVSKRGQFELTPLPGGRTRLEGTTWYSHGLYPEAYWRLWSDAIIHAIHRRVLNHVRELTESERGRETRAAEG